MLQTYLVTVAIHWQDEPQSVTERYERLEKPVFGAKLFVITGRGATSGDRAVRQTFLTFHLGINPKSLLLIGTSRKVIHFCKRSPKLWTT